MKAIITNFIIGGSNNSEFAWNLYDGETLVGWGTAFAEHVGATTFEDKRPAVITACASVAGVSETDVSFQIPNTTPFSGQGGSFQVRRSDGTIVSDPLAWPSSATVASGNAVYHPTSDGTGSGTALFDEIIGIQITVDGITQTVSTTLVSVATDKKTITISAKQLALAIAILNLSTNANGQKVDILVIGSRA